MIYQLKQALWLLVLSCLLRNRKSFYSHAKIFLTTVWDHCLCALHSKCVTSVTLHGKLITGARSVQFHQCVCQVHIWGSQWPSVLNTMPEKCRNPDVQGMFWPFCPQVCSLPLCKDLSMSFRSVSNILSSMSCRQEGSGFVRIKVECWDTFVLLCCSVCQDNCKSPLPCKNGYF